ncbi:MAG: hypothetical protein ACM3US_16630 [Sphingomonadaceae bacterium]
MSEAEGFGEEGPSGLGASGGPRQRGRELRQQAELAWARVQRVLQQGGRPSPDVERVMAAVERVPTAAYLAGISLSFFASVGLLSTGRRTASTIVGLAGPLVLGAALFLKATRQSRRS